MHQNQNATSNNRTDGLDDLFQRLASDRRLSAADKPIFARNLGEMAARLSPTDHLDGARRIVMQSGNEGLWPTKRKKYFRLPGEEVPAGGKDGEYASNPSQFKRLAEAAGELLCQSNKAETIEQWRKNHVKALVNGSSYMPTFMPTSIADQSAKALLDEYASVLSLALSKRTKIIELWQVLAETRIGIIPVGDGVTDLKEHPTYGGAEICPESLVRSIFRKHIKSAMFTTTKGFLGNDVSWAFPSITIGVIAIPVHIKMLRIPDDKSHLFECGKITDSTLSPEAQAWIKSIGFNLNDAAVFPSDDDSQADNLWTDVTAEIMLNVELRLKTDDFNEPCISISFWGDYPYVIGGRSSFSNLNENVISSISNEGLTQHIEIDVSEDERWRSGIDVIYAKPIDPNGIFDTRAIGILPSGWQNDLDIDDWETRPIWLDREEYWAIQDLEDQTGWTDNIELSEVLLTDKYRFYPLISEADPVASVLPEGSIGASILQNALHASEHSRISSIILDRSQELATAGLTYYEAMINNYRSAIHRI
jgi:hypothetical protein